MASPRLRMPTLALAALSIGLNLAILGCAGRSLHSFETERHSSVYFLPIWSSHFDTRELSALIGTSAVVLLLNAIVVSAVLVPTLLSALPLLPLASSVLSATVSLIAIIFTGVLNAQHPQHRETLQSWTCRWKDVAEQGVPGQFDALCHETRFAFYTTIPSFFIQLLLLSLAVLALLSTRPSPRGVRIDEEKHELHRVVRPQASFDTGKLTDSPKSMQDSVRAMPTKP